MCTGSIHAGLMFACSDVRTGKGLLSVYPSHVPMSGSTGLNGALDAHAVEQTGKNTFFGRTATLLQSVENLGNLQRILMRVVIVLLVSSSPSVGFIPLCFSYAVHTGSTCLFASCGVCEGDGTRQKSLMPPELPLHCLGRDDAQCMAQHFPLVAQIISVVLCLIALIYLLTDGEDFKHALGFIVVLLVASIPIAIEIVRCAHPLCCH